MIDNPQAGEPNDDINLLIRKYNQLMKRKADFELQFVAMLGERAVIDAGIKCNMTQQKRYYSK